MDVALLPVSGTYVMTAVEAAEAARRIDPGVAVPMHWGTVIGSREDAEAFVQRRARRGAHPRDGGRRPDGRFEPVRHQPDPNLYSAAVRVRSSRWRGAGSSSSSGRALRFLALGAVVGGVVLPLVRRRVGVPLPIAVTAAVAAPFGIAVAVPRSRARDAAVYGLQMWAYVVMHELPYEDPARLERRARVDYPIALRPRGVRLRTRRSCFSGRSARPGRTTALDHALVYAHWAWFLQPHARRGLDPVAASAAGSRVPATHDLRSVRPRPDRLLRGADRPALVGGGAGPDPGHAEDHGRGRGARLGAALVAPVRFPGRKPACGHALASLRDLRDGGPHARRDGAGGRGRRAGPTPACSASRSSTSASTTSWTSPPGRRWPRRSAGWARVSLPRSRRARAGACGAARQERRRDASSTREPAGKTRRTASGEESHRGGRDAGCCSAGGGCSSTASSSW